MEEVSDTGSNHVEYLYTKPPPLPLNKKGDQSSARDVKKERKSTSVPLSDLMDQQIENIVGGRLHREAEPKPVPSGSKTIPDKYICPVEQIEPDSHLGRALNSMGTH